MRRIHSNALLAGLVGMCVVLGVAGCSSSPSGEGHLIPSEATARKALEAALTAWREGQPAGKVEGGPATVQAVDFQWQAGQKIDSYEILANEPTDGPQWFDVQLTYKNSGGLQVTQQQKVRYAVLGKDPLWVYRSEDYTKLTGM
jgi:hypothetical protein